MIRIIVMYPNCEGTRFNMDYYLDHHMPLVKRLVGSALKGVSVEQGISGGAPGTPAPYVATGQLLFDSVESFQASFGPHAQAIMEDIPNYTNSTPIIQIAEAILQE